MIEGFEHETSPLNAEELLLVKDFVNSLQKRVGGKRAIKAAEITRIYKGLGKTVGGARVRKIINHIRTHDLLPRLVATSKGYYVEPDDEKLKDYIKSLRQRAEAIDQVRKAMIRQLNAGVKQGGLGL